MAAGFRFANYELDLNKRELRRGGDAVPIRPRIWEVLVYLARHAHRPVPADELRTYVWHAEALSESSIPTAINELRRVLGSDGDLLRTLPRRGYHLSCDVVPDFSLNSAPGRLFVGRDPEILQLQAAIEATADSSAQLVMIVGDPGIGKTSLAEHFCDLAHQQGFTVLLARCREDFGAPPFWPWAQVLSRWTADPNLDLAGSSPAERADFEALSQADPNAARFTIYNQLKSSILDITMLAPLLIVFEDIHRADIPSLEALRFVLEELPNARLLTCATYRDAEIAFDARHGEAIGALAQSAIARTIVLSGLSRDAVRKVASETRPHQKLPERLLDDLYRRSRGNPLFVHKLLELGSDLSAAPSTDHHVPRSLRDAIQAQMRVLPEATRQLLEPLAVLGPEAELGVLAELCGIGAPDCLRVFEPAFASRILETDHSGMVRFAHGLLWEVTYDQISAHDRLRLHASVGEALERAYDPVPEGMAGELATHFSRGQNSERALHYAQRAADWCSSQTAYREASGHLRLAISLLHPGTRNSLGVDLLIQLGEAELRAGNREAGREALLQAAREARRAGDASTLARAALALAPNVLSIEAGVVDGELIELLEDALKDPSLLSPEVRARVTARLSIALVWTGDTERRAQLAEEALSLAGALDDPTARSQALIARHSLVCTAAKRSEREQLIAELEALSANASLSESQLMASILRTTLLTELGDFPGVDLEIQRFKTLANRLRQPHFLWYVDLFSAMRHLMSGRFDDASRCVERFYEAGLHIQDANLWNCFGCHTAVQLWEQGQAERALSIVSDFVMRFPRFDTWRAGKLFLETEVGKLREVRAQYDPLIEADFGRLIPSENFRMTLNFLARCAVRLEDTAGAERLYAALLPDAGTMVLIGYAVVCWAPQDRELGVLAASLGDLGTAVDHFQSALALCEALEAKPLLAQTLFDLSKALDLLGNAAAKREARLLRNRAAGISAALGMKRLHDLTQS